MRNRSGLARVGAVLLAIAGHGALVLGLLLQQAAPEPAETAIEVVLAPIWRPAARREPPVRRLGASAPRERSPSAARPGRADRLVTPPPREVGGRWKVREPDVGKDDGLREALRRGAGCQSADLLALTKAEQEACEAKLAHGGKDSPAYAVISPKLKKQFDGEFECPKDDVWCEYRTGKAPYPGLFAPRRKKRPDWD